MAEKPAETTGTEAAEKDADIPTVVTAPVLVLAPEPEREPERPAVIPPPPEPGDPEPPVPDIMTVVMANATHGARWPGDVITVDAEAGRALVRSGEAFPA